MTLGSKLGAEEAQARDSRRGQNLKPLRYVG